MRIATGGFHIESCTFSPLESTEDDFQILRSDELLSDYPFLKKYNDVEMIPLVRARTIPNGVVCREFYEEIKEEFINGVKKHSPLEGIFLHLHGAAVVKGINDAEGDFIQSVRDAAGKKCFISASYDLHGNPSRKVMENLDFITAYRTAPHIDMEETEERAFSVMVDAIKNNFRPVKAFIPVPILLSGEQTSTEWQPAKKLYKMIPDIIDDKVFDASIFIGFAWADEKRVTASVTAFGKDKIATEDAAKKLADSFWQERNNFHFGQKTGTLNECIKAAADAKEYPVIISDSGDNPTAGAPGDIPNMIEHLLENNINDVVVAAIPDKEAVSICKKAGVGSEVYLSLGGKLDNINAKPLEISVTVLSLNNPLWSLDTGNAGIYNEIAVVEAEGIKVIITERRTPFFTIDEFTQIGINPAEHKIIIVKMGYLSPELDNLCKESYLALTKGAVNQHIKNLPFKNIERPMFPFDTDMKWNVPEEIIL